MKLGKILISVLLVSLIMFNAVPALATPPSNPHVGSSTAEQGGYYFEYHSSSGWKNLKTPHHWIIETDEIAYCIEHTADAPSGNETYGAFDPSAVYSSTTYNGLISILKNGYPYQTGGLSANQARYAIANAIRAWLSESAGIGYNFMKLSRGYVRPKSGYQNVYNWMVSLVEKARSNIQPTFAISASPSNVKLTKQGNNLVGQVTINLVNINNKFTIDNSKIPSGVSISGYTGNNGNILTIEAPLSYAGQSVNMNKILVAQDTRVTSNIYWFKASGNKQPVIVPVTDSEKPVAYGNISFNSVAGSITINKTATDTGQKIDGATFRLYDSSNALIKLTKMSDGNYTYGGSINNITTKSGTASIIKIPEGNYTVKEISPPPNYNLDGTNGKSANITSSSQNKTVNFSNTPAGGYVKLIKHGEDNTSRLHGAVYGIYKMNGTKVGEITTNANGEVRSGFLQQNNYYLQEITPPTGYLKSSTKHNFTIQSNGQTVTINANNTIIKGRVSILKAGETNNPLANATFGIYTSNNTKVGEITTNASGQDTSDFLPYGSYYLKEITSPTGYNLSPNKIPFTISQNNVTVELQESNSIIRGRVQIFKTGETDNPLQDDVYGVYDTGGTLIEELTTDENGIAISDELVYGDYYLKEITPPTGYNHNETPIPFEIREQGVTIELTADNILIRGKVQILKMGETDNPLHNAVYGIYDTGDTLIEELTTDENGIAISTELVYGDYYLKEIAPPPGYNLNEMPISFEIREQGRTVELTADNSIIRGRVQILKTGETGNPLQGAVYGVYDTGDALIEELTTDENGIAVSDELVYGDHYLKEITSPVGYNLNQIPIPFEIREQSVTVELTADNTKIRGRVQIIKSGERQGVYLEGAVFGLYTLDNELIYTLKTDENGQITSELLEYGKYYLLETTPPTGHILDNTKYYFAIQNNKETIVMNVSNTWLRGQVEIIKTDIETGQPLQGAVFGVYNMADELLQEIITETNGYAISEPFTYGQYYIKEITPPTGYTFYEKSKQFFIEQDKQIIHFDFENLIIKGKVQITKTSASDGIPLKSAVFGIFTSDDALIEELTTDENGVVLSSDLNYGEYYLQELNVPGGYILDDTPYPFSITKDGVIVEMDIQNHPIVGSVEVYFRHVRHTHELHDAYSYTDWVKEEYMPWVDDNELDKKPLDGYTFIRADYPSEPVLIDGKLTITYWYDDAVTGGWTDVTIPKTGQAFPAWSYITAGICILLAGLVIVLYKRKSKQK